MSIKTNLAKPGNADRPPIHLDYYGTDGKLKWSKTWQQSPFEKGATIDWKTGTLRTLLYEEAEDEQQEDIPAAEMTWPQWHVSLVPNPAGAFSETETEDVSTPKSVDWSVSVGAGQVIWAKLSSVAVSEDSLVKRAVTCRTQMVPSTEIEVDVPGVIALVREKSKEPENSGEADGVETQSEEETDTAEISIQFFGEDASHDDYDLYIPLANLEARDDEDEDVQPWIVTQLETSPIYLLDDLTPLRVNQSMKSFTITDINGDTTTYSLFITDGDGESSPLIGIMEETGGGGEDGPGENPDSDAPPCGHPGNEAGAGTAVVDHDTNHPFASDEAHPGDNEGSNGITPESSGECP